METRSERLAKALLADRERFAGIADQYPACFACGARRRLRFGRFCSQNCLDAYDAGFPGHEQDWLKPSGKAKELRSTATGFLWRCAGCGGEFSSSGLKYCKPECARLDRQREENLAIMAEVGVEPAPKRRCEQCGGVIPKWTRGKLTRKDARFCSAKCAARARRAKTGG